MAEKEPKNPSGLTVLTLGNHNMPPKRVGGEGPEAHFQFLLDWETSRFPFNL